MPSDFYRSAKVKSAFSVTPVCWSCESEAARVLKELTVDDIQRNIGKLKICMERCRNKEGMYIEGENNEICMHKNKLQRQSCYFIATLCFAWLLFVIYLTQKP